MHASESGTPSSLVQRTSWGTTTRRQSASPRHVCGSPSRNGRPEPAPGARLCAIRTSRTLPNDRAVASPPDDEGQRRPRLSNPRNADVRLLAWGCRPTLSPAALPVAEQSAHAGAVAACGVEEQSRRSGLGLARLGRRQRANASGPRQPAAPTRSSPVISTCSLSTQKQLSFEVITPRQLVDRLGSPGHVRRSFVFGRTRRPAPAGPAGTRVSPGDSEDGWGSAARPLRVH
jgi:hypothetical protein